MEISLNNNPSDRETMFYLLAKSVVPKYEDLTSDRQLKVQEIGGYEIAVRQYAKQLMKVNDIESGIIFEKTKLGFLGL